MFATSSPARSPPPTTSPTFTTLPTPSSSPSPSPGPSFDGHPLPSWFSLVAAIVLLVGGLWVCFFGYRYFRHTLSVMGATAAGVTVWLLTYDHIADGIPALQGNANAVLGISVATGFLAGVLGGVGCWFLKKVGVFVIGGGLGVLLSYVLNVTWFARLNLGSQANTPLIVSAVVLGLSFGAIALRFMRITVIISTSTIGAFGTLAGVGQFAGSFPGLDIASQVQNGQQLSAAAYGYIAGICCLAIVGVIVQLCVTGRRKAKGVKDAAEIEFDEADDLGLLTGASVWQKRGVRALSFISPPFLRPSAQAKRAKRGVRRVTRRSAEKDARASRPRKARLMSLMTRCCASTTTRRCVGTGLGAWRVPPPLCRACAALAVRLTPRPSPLSLALQNGYSYAATGYDEGGDEYYEEGIQDEGFYEEEEVEKPKKGWGVSFWGGGGSAVTAAASDQQIELQPATRGSRKAAPKEVEW